MKSYTLILLVIICGFFLSGCSDSSTIGNAISDNSYMCSKIASNIEKDNCINTYSLKENNPENCNKISDSDLQRSCYNTILSKINYNFECTKISDQSIQNNCLNKQAKEEINPGKCKLISSEDKQFDCFVGLSRLSKNLTYCELSPIKQSECINHIIKKLKLTSDICNNLLDETNKKTCLSNFS